MMRRIDDLYAREKRKAATGKTDVDFAKLPVLKKFEERGRYVLLGPLGCSLQTYQASGSGQIGRGGGESPPYRRVRASLSTNFLAFHFDMQLQMASPNVSDHCELHEPFKLHQKEMQLK